MVEHAIGSLFLFVLILLASAHLLGNFFARLRQPRVIGEILAGVLVGPSVLKVTAGFGGAPPASEKAAIDVLYWLGLLFLMFLSGAETRDLFNREDRKEVSWLAIVGTGLPFIVALALGSRLSLSSMMGTVERRTPLLLVVGIAVAVTSIPVISRIFFDLKILHTRFARLVLGVAVVEDIGLWAVLAIATALAQSQSVPASELARQIAFTLVYFVVGLTLMPRVLARIHEASWNAFARTSPAAYLLMILFAYVGLAAALKINLVFAAFLAGLVVPNRAPRFIEAVNSVKSMAFGYFIPIYFALVGYKLDLGKGFSLSLLAWFLVIACVIKLMSVLLGARLAGFSISDSINLAVATNARGGPGIVLASVAYEAGIINAQFYTTLILLAVLTSQLAGAWLEFVLRRGRPLLSEQAAGTAAAEPADVNVLAA
jgi:Kef-type K+ transport system membrane component KefB